MIKKINSKIKKGSLKKLEFKTNKLKFGLIGLKSKESGVLNLKQINSAKQTILKKMKKQGKIWTRIFPNISITKKSIGTRMGKGKGQISHWSAKISAGTVLFEICGTNYNKTISALKAGSAKLCLKTKIFE